MHIWLWTLVPPVPLPLIVAHDWADMDPYLSSAAVTMCAATVTPVVSPLSEEKGLYSPTNFTPSLGPRESLFAGEQPILSGCLKKAAVSIMLLQHFMLQNDKWREERQSWGAAEAHTHAETMASEGPCTTWIWSLRLSLSAPASLLLAHKHPHTHTHAYSLCRLDSWSSPIAGGYVSVSKRGGVRGGLNRLTCPTSPCADPGEWEVAVSVPRGPVAPLSSGQSSSSPPPT